MHRTGTSSRSVSRGPAAGAAVVAGLVGGLILARAVDDPELADTFRRGVLEERTNAPSAG
jgi:hypothetical protein